MNVVFKWQQAHIEDDNPHLLLGHISWYDVITYYRKWVIKNTSN